LSLKYKSICRCYTQWWK